MGTAATKQGRAAEARAYLRQVRALYLQLPMTPQVAEIEQKSKSLGPP